MTAIRSRSIFAAALALLALAIADPARAAQRALLVYDLNGANEPIAAGHVRDFLLARGFTVDSAGQPPADMSAYCCVWDIRPFEPLTDGQKSAYLSFVQKGHGLFLVGENENCCDPRNQSLIDFINNRAGGGGATLNGERLGVFTEIANASHPATTFPRRVNAVTYNGRGAAIFGSVGNGDVLTFSSSPLSQAAAGWRAGDLASASGGRLVAVLDINWMVDQWGVTDNADFVENISYFLCPVTAGSLAVDITSPSSFNLECPASLTVLGQVTGSAQDCEQPTTLSASFAPLVAPALPLEAAAMLDAAPRPQAPEAYRVTGSVGPALWSTESTLAASEITSIRVSVNGGPFVAVTSTSPGLPAPTPVSFTASNLPLVLGSNTIVIEARDDLGNRDTDSITGTLRDTVPPVIDPATCQDVVVDLGPGCMLDYAGVPVATDVCDPTVSITANPPLPVHFPGPGTVVITYEAKDDAGNKDSCARQVTARDISGPTLVCALPVTVECKTTGGTPAADPQIQAFLAATTATDNCALDSLSHDAPAFFDSGCTPGKATTVTFTATDKSLNSSTCASDLSVIDSTPPSFTSTPGRLSLECNEPGGVAATDPAIQAWLAQFQGSDICSSTVTGSDDAPALFPAGCAPGQETTVTYTLADDCNNEATASAIVAVLDSTAPVLSVPPPLTLECNGTGGVLRSDPAVQAWLALASASDLCGAASVIDDTPALLPSGCGPGATTTVTFRATDGCGLRTSLTSTITVKDTAAPVLTVPAPITLECNGPGGIAASDPAIAAWLAAASATDTCGTTTLADDAPLLFPSGCGPGAATTVTFTASDDCGNVVSQSSTITVRDTTAPALTVPAPLALECNAAGGVPKSDPAVLAWLGTASASDVCDGATIAEDAPALLPSGCAPGKTTTVTFTATDNCGNANPEVSTVTVVDTTAPVLTAPAPITLECNGPNGIAKSDPAIAAWLTSFASSDLCGSLTVSDNAPALFPSGCGAGTTTTVTFSAVDNCGNQTTRTSTVTVRDTTAPTLNVPAALTLECNGPNGIPKSDPAIAAWLAAATGSDLCDGATLSNNAPAFFPSGCGAGTATTVTFSAVDNCGNAVTRTATVTVRDTSPPALSVPAALTLECNGPGGVAKSDPAIVAWLAAATGSDVCDGTTISNNAPILFPSGCGAGTTTVVTFSAVDNCGNVTTRTSSVTVRDTTAPALTVPAPITLECNGPGGIPLSDPQVQAWLASAAASDVCDGATIVHDAPALFPSGCAPGTTTVVTFTAVDNCGNATLRTSSITVQDTTPPVIGPVAFDGICLWPPNHNFYCIEDVTRDVSASDVCDPGGPEVRVLSCRSSQPEEGNGDGNFEPDCVITDAGRGVCVRSERDGRDPAGRVYTIEVGATDGCGNAAGKKVEIRVPHDQSPKSGCLKPNRGKEL